MSLIPYQREVSAERNHEGDSLRRRISELEDELANKVAECARNIKQRMELQEVYFPVFTDMRAAFDIPDKVPFSQFGRWIQQMMRERQRAAEVPVSRVESKTHLVAPEEP